MIHLQRWKRKLSRSYSEDQLIGLVAAGSLLVLALLLLLERDSAPRYVLATAFVSAFNAIMILLYTRENILATKQMVTESRDGRLAQSRPQVLVSFEVETKLKDFVLMIGHYGGGPARNVRFEFKPPLVNHEGTDIGAKPPFSTGIPLMVPGQRQRVWFADFSTYQLDWLINESPQGIVSIPSKFATTITLNDPLADDQEYKTTYVLDLEHLLERQRPRWESVGPDHPLYQRYIGTWTQQEPAEPEPEPEPEPAGSSSDLPQAGTVTDTQGEG
jgi:hypothetical protein